MNAEGWGVALHSGANVYQSAFNTRDMPEVGPTGPESDAEIDGDPAPADVRATVEWSATTENVEIANFEFEDDGEIGPHLQMIGELYNLTALRDDRVERAQSVLRDFVSDSEDLEPKAPGDYPPYLEVEIDTDAATHKTIIERLLTEVYDTDLDEIEVVRRSTFDKPVATAEPVTCPECEDLFRDFDYLTHSEGPQLYASQELEQSLEDDGLDMLRQLWLKSLCSECHG